MYNAIELCWSCSYQVAASKTPNRKDVTEDGSGFFINYQKTIFFLTAGYVLNPEDFQEGLRKNEARYLSIVTNKNDEQRHESILAPIGGFIDYTELNKDALSAWIHDEEYVPNDMPDIAFTSYVKPNGLMFYTHKLTDKDGHILVEQGLPKAIISEDMFADENNIENEFYIVAGVVQNRIVDGEWQRCNVIHTDLQYKETLSDGIIVLSVPYMVNIKHWEALSGSPVFSSDGKLLGMLTRVAGEKYNHALVIPIRLIIRYIDLAIKTGNV